MKLFEIHERFVHLMEWVEKNVDEFGEVPDYMAKGLEEEFSKIELAESHKLANFGLLIRQAKSESAVCQAEIDQFKKKKQVAENKEKWLKAYVYRYLKASGKADVATSDGHKFRIQGNSVAPLIVDDGIDLDAIDAKYVMVKKSLHTDQVRESLRAGEPVPFARFGDKGEHLRYS